MITQEDIDKTSRPDKHHYATLADDSWFVHGGNRPDAATGAIRTPIVVANSYLLPEDPTTLADDDPDLLVYTRESGANRLGLQTKLAALEHGEAAAVFATGMAALHATFFSVRLRRHCHNAQRVAEFLARDPRISHVGYPGLTDDPHHALADRQLTGGYGGVVSFAISGSHQDRVRFVNDLRVITSAGSLGHDETLIAYEQYPETRAAAFAPEFREHGLIRLAIGLEGPEDLIADLDAALTTAYGAAT